MGISRLESFVKAFELKGSTKKNLVDFYFPDEPFELESITRQNLLDNLWPAAHRLDECSRNWLVDKSMLLRRLAVFTIGVRGDSRLWQKLRDVVGDSDNDRVVRLGGISALGNLRSEEGTGALLDLYNVGLPQLGLDDNKSDGWLAERIILEALAWNVGPLTSLDRIRALEICRSFASCDHKLNRESASVVALMEIGRLGLHHLLVFVHEQTESDEPFVRWAALYAACMLEGRKRWGGSIMEELSLASRAEIEQAYWFAPLVAAAARAGDLGQVRALATHLKRAVSDRHGWHADWWLAALKSSPLWSAQDLGVEWKSLFGVIRHEWTWQRSV